MIYDRASKETSAEKVYKDKTTAFLYNTAIGGICLLILRLPVISGIYGVFQKISGSKKKIEKFIETYQIDMNGCKNDFRSFNDFIIRKRTSLEFDANPNHLIAPADSCLLVYTIRDGRIPAIKNKTYTLSKFLKGSRLAREYEGGIFLIFRLRVYDYHRFCFADSGEIVSRKRIRGFLDSVNSAATGRFALCSNYREISVLKTTNFGDTVFAEIGAMLVGRIVQTHKKEVFNRGDEKGCFEFGGSSIVLILKKNMVKIDDDILNYSAKNIETKVKMGEKIGEKFV